MVLVGTAASHSKICMSKLLVRTSLHEPSWNFIEILVYTLRVYVGLKMGKKPWQRGQEKHMCVCALMCVIALRWSSSLWPGSGCMWDLMSAYQLTTHTSLHQGCSSLLTEMLWNVAYEKSKMKCFCNIMRGKTNVGVHENIQASLLTRAGRGGDGSFCAFIKQVK